MKDFFSKILSSKFFKKTDKKYFIWGSSILLAIIILIVVITLLIGMGGKAKNNNCKIGKNVIQMSDIGSCTGVFVSYSDSYKISKSGVFTFTGSKWVNGDKIQNLIDQSQIDSSYFYYKFFDKNWLDQNMFLYDETGGLKAGLLTFVMRSLGKNNVYLLQGKDIKTIITQDKAIVDDDLKNLFSGENNKLYDKGYIDNGKYKVVFNTSGVNLGEKDLFLYVSDKGMMESDPFYNANKDTFKDNLKYIYISYFISLEGDSVKTKDEVTSLLFNEGIELNKYDNVYIYYPGEWWKSGLIGLIFIDYFG